jgi:hypothetical protein
MWLSCDDKTNFTVLGADNVSLLKVVGINTGSGGGSGGDSIWTDVDGDAVLETDGKKLTIDANVGELGLKSRITTDASTLELKAGSGGIADVTIADTGLTTVADMTVNGVTVGKGNGNLNTVLGNGALSANTTGGDTVAVGNGALRLNDTGSRNTAVGYNSLTKATNVKENTAIGWGCLAKATEGSVNTGVGDSCLSSLLTGGYNTAVGNAALTSLTTGDQNVGIGRSAGNQLTTGSNVICIGYNSNPSSPSVSNEVTIGNDSITKTRLKGQVTMNDNLTINSGELFVTGMSTTGLSANVVINSSGQLQKSTETYYSADDVDKKLAIKDKLIEKLSARLDELEKKVK